MKINKFYIVLPCCLMGLALGIGTGCRNPEVAVVNGHPISRTLFEQAVRIELMKHDPILLRDATRMAALKERVLETLVTNTLLANAAAQAGVRPTAAELEDAVNTYKGEYTEEAFQAMLQSKGIEYVAWRSLREQQYYIDRYWAERGKHAAEATIPTAAVEEYYREHREEFAEPESARVRQIVTADEATAKQLRERILKGANFAQLAAEYSLTPDGKQGGDLGYIRRGSFPAVFDEVCFRLPVGAMSDVVQSEYGFHLLKVLDRRPARVIPLSEARETIRQRLRADATAASLEEQRAALRKKARVTIRKDVIAKVVVP
ncbi:MAG: peptidyl-prolyl cis-trans isomerase [Deltaproteobacteria bacterium]|nr:peptidyl-prolyl cis-trans isomerase [Deltaproteobacteria bacterium]